MFATPKCFSPRAVPMSVFVPHVDASFSFENIAYQFETVFEIGTVDRIEAVPKTNQTDGHAYLACYIYFSKWGNGYNAQDLRNRLMAGMQTRMYIQPSLYWKICNNTSVVHEENIPFPKHMSLLVMSNRPNSLLTTLEVLEQMDVGKMNTRYSKYVDDVPLVSAIPVTNAYLQMHDTEFVDEYRSSGALGAMEHPTEVGIVHLDYWFHSKAAHEFQQALATTGVMNYCGFDDEGACLVFVPYPEVATAGIHPYIWHAPSRPIKALHMNHVYAYGTLMHELQNPLSHAAPLVDVV